MRINKVTFHNFRQFVGDQSADLTVDEKNPVVVIVGKNGSGKSTFIDSFTWCLYDYDLGEDSDDDVDKSPLNQMVQEKMKEGDEEKASVEVEIEVKGDVYFIKKVETFVKQSGRIKSTNVERKISAQKKGKFIEKEKKEVEDILPKGISRYFFFKGENLEDLGNPNNKVAREAIKDAITSILGMDILDGAIKHIGGQRGQLGVISSFEKEFASVTSGELKETNMALKKKREKKTDLEDINAGITQQIDGFDAIIDEIEILFKNNKTTKDIQIEITQLREDLKNCNNDLDIFFKSYINEMSKGMAKVLIAKMVKEALPIVEKNPTIGYGVPGMHADAINFLIIRQMCVCGTSLKDQNRLIEHLEKEKRYLPPESIGITVHGFKTIAEDYLDGNDDWNVLSESHNNLVDKRVQIVDLESKIKLKQKELYGTADLTDKVEQLKSANDKRDELIENRGGNRQQIEQLKEEIIKLKNRQDILASADKKNDVARQCTRTAELISQAFIDYRNNKHQRITDELTDLINEAFQTMYSDGKTKVIEISPDKFDISLYYIMDDNSKKKLSINEGQRVVLTCSYIVSIISLARSYIGRSNEYIEGDDYPVVMDAPFSKVDSENIERVANYMTGHTTQWIVLVNPKDWNASRKLLESKAKKVYELDKQSAIKTVIVNKGGL